MASEKDGTHVLERPVIDEISPTSTPRPPTDTELRNRSPRSPPEQDGDAKRVEQQEASQYWGYMVKQNNCGSEKLDCLLAGIAQYISTNFKGASDCPDLTPKQLGDFYRAVGGNYDELFVETAPASIATIYKTLGCLHSIQPENENKGHEDPTIPALKPKGFIKWQTIQLLLGPEEHVPFLQAAVEQFDIVDPTTGEIFPKVLPDNVFPKQPVPAMVKWYEDVHAKLQRDMQLPEVPQRSLSISDATISDRSDDERVGAYFRNPRYMDHDGRPGIVAQRGAYKSPRSRGSRQTSFADRGKAVFNGVRHFISPSSESHHHHGPPKHGRRGSIPERYREDTDDDYEDVTPTGLHPDYRNRQARPPPKSPELLTDSDSDSVHVTKRPNIRRASSREQRERENRERDATERRLQREIKELSRERERDRHGSSSKHDSKSPPLRHRRSFEPQVSPVDYFPRQYFDDEPRRNSHSHPHRAYAGPDVSFAPSKEPSMASRVANIQHSSRTSSPRRTDGPRGSGGGSYPPRSVPPPEGSYNGRPTVRYSRRSIDEERRREREREQERPRYERGSRGSDDRLHEPRNEHSGSRSRSYERDRDPAERVRQSTRYVDGASGRRYPSNAPWE